MPYVDTSGWKRKIKKIMRQNPAVIKRAVDFGMDTLYKETLKNLSGPHYPVGVRGPMTGKMPIPRVTGTLVRSLSAKRVSFDVGFVYTDKRIANYNALVHDGTKHTKPRRYLGDAVRAKRQAIINRMKYEILLAIRKEGMK